jgi:hypothetical protein
MTDDDLVRDYPYKKTVLKVSHTDNMTKWHVTLWHYGKNIDIRTIKARDIKRASVVAVSQLILERVGGAECTTNLKIIKGMMY